MGLLQVVVLGPEAPLFEGEAERVILPGEQGVFEVFPFHRPLASRLLTGAVIVDDQLFPIQRGTVWVERNQVTALVEPA